MLTIGRALMTNPELLLLDEPTEGLAPLVVKMLAEQIMKLKETGLTVLLAEQNQEVALNLSDRGYIIDNGVIRFSGSIEDLRANEGGPKEIPHGLSACTIVAARPERMATHVKGQPGPAMPIRAVSYFICLWRP